MANDPHFNSKSTKTSKSYTISVKLYKLRFESDGKCMKMGFERNMETYCCGCFSKEISHDSFNYTDEGEYRNVCGNHPCKESAKEEHDRLLKVFEVAEKARDELVSLMKANRIAHHLANRRVISRGQKKRCIEGSVQHFKSSEANQDGN